MQQCGVSTYAPAMKSPVQAMMVPAHSTMSDSLKKLASMMS